MAVKKYMSLERMEEYNDLIQAFINSGDSSTLSSSKSYSDTNLETAQTYTDNAVAQKSQVQIITWGDED